ncbi:MAG TPA: hypothetical protein VG713_11345 [Pirellulales bacterium]|nr:hypothetical protein [Pirellulales bacterium]
MTRRSGVERRRYFRAPIAAGGNAALLIWDDNQADVRVVEESAGGFTAVSILPLPIDRGVNGELRTNDRRMRVCVRSVVKSGTGVRIGLELMGDLTHSDNDPRRRHKKGWMAVGVVLAAMVVLVPILMQGRAWSTMLVIFPFLKPEPGWRPEMPPLVLDKEVRQMVRRNGEIGLLLDGEIGRLLDLSDAQRREIERLVERDPERNAEEALEAEPSELRMLNPEQRWRLHEILEQSTSPLKLIQRLALQTWPRANARQLLDRLGVAALTVSSTTKELKLTPEQQKKIATIIEAALDMSEDLYRDAKETDPPNELKAKANAALEQARIEAMAVLTPDQVRILELLPR